MGAFSLSIIHRLAEATGCRASAWSLACPSIFMRITNSTVLRGSECLRERRVMLAPCLNWRAMASICAATFLYPRGTLTSSLERTRLGVLGFLIRFLEVRASQFRVAQFGRSSTGHRALLVRGLQAVSKRVQPLPELARFQRRGCGHADWPAHQIFYPFRVRCLSTTGFPWCWQPVRVL